MSNAEIKTYARELADVLRQISEHQEAAKDLIASAKDAGVNVKALRKVARELVMESDKRQKLYDDEEQTDLFRNVVGLFAGVSSRKADAARDFVLEDKLNETASELDAMLGTDLAKNHATDMKRIREWKARKEAAE